MRFKLMILGVLGIMALESAALEVTLTPGSFKTQFLKVKSSGDRTLTLKGTADVTDLALLRELPGQYTTVDMSGLAIEAYTYKQGSYMGQKSFAAGELPAFMLFGSNVASFRFPADTKVIGTAAFANSPLSQLQIPASVEKIGDYAFSRMPKLQKAAIPGSAEMGKGLFRFCPNLSEVSIDGTLKDIPEDMFKGCGKITSVPAGTETIGNSAFRLTGVTSVDLTGVTSVGEYAFAENPKLTSVVLDPDSDTKFGIGAFFADVALEEIPNWFSGISPLMLAHTKVSGTRSINMPIVGGGVLANAGSVKDVVLGPEVKEVQSHAFRNLKSLQTIDVTLLEGNIPEVTDEAFSGLGNADGNYDIQLAVYRENEPEWKNHPVWGKFRINGTATNADMPVVENVNVSRRGGTVIVSSSSPMDKVEVFGLSGIKRYEGGENQSRVEVEISEPGVLLVRIMVSGKIIVKKI